MTGFCIIIIRDGDMQNTHFLLFALKIIVYFKTLIKKKFSKFLLNVFQKGWLFV